MSPTKNNISNSEIQKLVIERVRTLPAGRKISIGSEGDFSKEELIGHIKRGDNIGKKMVDVQLSFLQSLKTGTLLNEE